MQFITDLMLSYGWLCDRGKNGKEIRNYEGLNEEEKIAAFYEYFECHVREELEKYNCKNKSLMDALENKRYG